MLSGEATQIIFIDFGLTRAGLEPTIYRAGGRYASHYTTDVVPSLAIKGVGMISAEFGLKNRQIINETFSFRCFLIL
jgi:hypothetical protein